jgi:hypothetical protein
VARRRDLRRFGPGPYVTALRRHEACWGHGFPFDVPAVAAAGDLALDAPFLRAESFFNIAPERYLRAALDADDAGA